MKPTGARLADQPSVQAEIVVAAPPERVWRIITDVSLMPEMSEELRYAAWRPGTSGPAVGAEILGRSWHPARGEWETVSTVIECAEHRAFAWCVGDPSNPAAVWRFTLSPAEGGTRLTQSARMGPGPSGLTEAIARWPDKERKIVHVRLREWERYLARTLAAIKERAEATSTTPA